MKRCLLSLIACAWLGCGSPPGGADAGCAAAGECTKLSCCDPVCATAAPVAGRPCPIAPCATDGYICRFFEYECTCQSDHTCLYNDRFSFLDLAKPGPGCFAILGGQSSIRSPQRSKDLFNAFFACADATCGVPDLIDGGAPLPCSTTADGGGVSVQCDRCFANVQVNDQITFTDPTTMMPVVCEDIDTGNPDTAGLGCKACANEIVACLLDCNSDKDCVGLTDSGGSTATCQADNTCGF